MEIGRVQQFRLARPYPLLPLMALALRAVPVPTTVIAQVEPVATCIVAAVDVPAKGGGTAFAKGMERSQLPAVGANAR